jgi:hypothetical protein
MHLVREGWVILYSSLYMNINEETANLGDDFLKDFAKLRSCLEYTKILRV